MHFKLTLSSLCYPTGSLKKAFKKRIQSMEKIKGEILKETIGIPREF